MHVSVRVRPGAAGAGAAEQNSARWRQLADLSWSDLVLCGHIVTTTEETITRNATHGHAVQESRPLNEGSSEDTQHTSKGAPPKPHALPRCRDKRKGCTSSASHIPQRHATRRRHGRRSNNRSGRAVHEKQPRDSFCLLFSRPRAKWHRRHHRRAEAPHACRRRGSICSCARRISFSSWSDCDGSGGCQRVVKGREGVRGPCMVKHGAVHGIT